MNDHASIGASIGAGTLAGVLVICLLGVSLDCSGAVRQRMKHAPSAARECRETCEAAGLRVGSFSLETRRCECTSNYRRNVIEVRR